MFLVAETDVGEDQGQQVHESQEPAEGRVAMNGQISLYDPYKVAKLLYIPTFYTLVLENQSHHHELHP